MKPMASPLIVDKDFTCLAVDGKIHVAIFDQTPAKNLVGFMLEGDAEEYVRFRNAGECVDPESVP